MQCRAPGRWCRATERLRATRFRPRAGWTARSATHDRPHRGGVDHRRAVQHGDLTRRHGPVGRHGHDVVAQRCATEPRDEGDAQSGADEGEVGVELHGHVRDPGRAAGAVVHPHNHCRQIVPSGVATHGSSTRSRGETRVRPASRWPRGTITSATSRAMVTPTTCSGTCRGTSPQLCTMPRSCWPEATRSMVSQGSRSVRVRARSGCWSRSVRTTGATSPRMAVEKAAMRSRPATRPASRCRPDSSCLEVGQQTGSVGDQPPSVLGEHHAAPDPLEQCHSCLLLQSLDLLGDRAGREAEGVGGADHGAVGVDSPQAGQGGQINHVAMLHRSVHNHSLVLHHRIRPDFPREHS